MAVASVSSVDTWHPQIDMSCIDLDLTPPAPFLRFLFQQVRLFGAKVKGRTVKKDPLRFITARCAVRCMAMFLEKCAHLSTLRAHG